MLKQKNIKYYKKSSGIYSILNIINLKEYIGKSQNIQKRWKEHIKSSSYSNKPLYADMRKYGIKNFRFKILRYTTHLDYWERYYIKKHNTFYKGYNFTRGGKYDSFDKKEQKIIRRWKDDH